jgi:zinc/manganese transport system substrate-binding protein
MRVVSLLAWALCCLAVSARADPIAVVTAENFYGDVAKEVGGPWIRVSSILSNPNQAPHLFAANPSTARAIAAARIVVFNGAAYDDWMAKLLAGLSGAHRQAIDGRGADASQARRQSASMVRPATMPSYAAALAALLIADDPAHQDGYRRNLAAFRASLAPLRAKIAAMRRAYRGTPVTATEPVFGYMASAIGLDMRNQRFQIAVMNDTEPASSDIAAFENDLTRHRVRVLVYNNQTEDALTDKMRGMARAAGIPVVGVSETEPPGKDFRNWMTAQLSALDSALARRRP